MHTWVQGLELGLAEGLADGLVLGLPLGEMLGDADGLALGELLGLADGDTDAPAGIPGRPRSMAPPRPGARSMGGGGGALSWGVARERVGST